MRLKNKKTGEIVNVVGFDQSCDEIKMRFVNENNEGRLYVTDSLTTFSSDWEDYEEPKDFWYIDVECGVMCDSTNPDLQDKRYPMEFMKAIGNYFETREEAEKAVEKLKAWKRLKDKGFGFINFGYEKLCKYDVKNGVGNLQYQVPYYYELEADLDLLFGGEE